MLGRQRTDEHSILPSNPSPSGALPSRFRRLRVLIVGCGDVGQRAAALLRGRVQLLALTSSRDRAAGLRRQGIVPLAGDLDAPDTLRRLAGLGHRVLHLAPPPGGPGSDGQRIDDPRTRALMQVLVRRAPPAALVYGSTSGVYGDCNGAWVDETRRVRPATARAQRRVDAEGWVRQAGRRGLRASILRIPGIYAPDREGGTPRARLERGTPVLVAGEDVFTNHIHADDLARACVAALFRGAAQRTYHASDDTELKMGDYMDLAAGLYGLPRPPRVRREDADPRLGAATLSFMGESRRLVNRRLKAELRMVLRYPTVATGLLSKE